MKILIPTVLKRVDSLKSRIDSSKLDSLVDDIFARISRQVLQHAPIQDFDNEERGVEVVKNFYNAWHHARDTTSNSFDLVYLQKIAGQVEPKLCTSGEDYARFRDSSARFSGMNIMPPIDELRIRKNLEQVLRSVNEIGMHPLEESMFLYFHLARIQPFNNGNKRTANIVMNTSLLREGLAPISIRPSEEDIFKSYFMGALAGYQEDSSYVGPRSLKAYLHPGIKQKQFYEYLAEREAGSLARVISHLKGLNQYTIELETKNPNVLYGVKRKISSWHNRKEGRPFKQTVDGKGIIHLTGAIPYVILQKILEDSKPGLKSYGIHIRDKK